MYAQYIAIFTYPYIVYLHSKCLQKFINLTSAILMLNTYKHLHSLTFSSCLLNNQLQTPTLIFINTVPSVSYCCTVMLYLTVFLSCILLITPINTSWKGYEFLVSRGKYTSYEAEILRGAESRHSN